MNAFTPAEVERVLDLAAQKGWIEAKEQGGGRHVLYLTGQPRESGMAVAKQYGLQVACVGHRAAEDWGIRYMARRLREHFPGVDVKEVYEEEEPRVRAVREDAPRE
jgi:putative NIF3 family GTP cyclohydrolase 1 type 2